MFTEYEIPIYLPSLTTIFIWMIIGFIVSAINLHNGLKKGFTMHKWWYMPVGFIAVAVVWPWVLYELYHDRIV